MKYVSAGSLNTASRTSFERETTSKFDYCCGNSHFAHQTPFDFDDNQHRFKKDQYIATVGAGILKTNIFIKQICLQDGIKMKYG